MADKNENKILNNNNLSQSVQPESQESLDHGVFDVSKSAKGNTIDVVNSTVNGRKYNIQNLKPYNPKYNNHLTTEEAQKRGRNGGKKSGEIRRQRKTMRESLLTMLSMELSEEKLTEMGIDTSTLDGDYTMQGALLSAMLREAVNGSEKAMALVRDTIGEMPVTKTENVTEVITKDDADLMDNIKQSLIS